VGNGTNVTYPSAALETIVNPAEGLMFYQTNQEKSISK
jgi:hypothetical protein